MIWTPIEQDWLTQQLVAVLPRRPDRVADGVPALLEALPTSRRWALRALVWWVAAAGRSSGVGAVLRRWEEADGWARREAVVALKLAAALVWEADGGELGGWGGGGPVVLPERRGRLEPTSESTFAPEELH